MSAKFQNIIILTDLDGTFLGESGSPVPDNLRAVDYFKSNGGLFTCATGREWWLALSSLPFLSSLVNCPAITCNGAVIYDFVSAKTIAREPLDPSVRALAIDVSNRFPEAVVKITVGDKWYCPRELDIDGSISERVSKYRIVAPFDQIPDSGWLKVLFGGSPELIANIRAYAEPKYPGFRYLQAWPNCVEVQSERGTKGYATSQYKSLLHLDKATLWAVGDYENDVGMLLAADRCACPDNAIPCVKSLDNILVLRDHKAGAIADLIDRLDHN